MPKASIIIPTKNGAEYLEECLKAVFGQKTAFPFEVVIVDSGSTDRTLEIVGKFQDRIAVDNDFFPSLDEEGAGGGVDKIETTPLRHASWRGTSPQLKPVASLLVISAKLRREGGIVDFKLFQIPPLEFGHGKTRNFAASKTQGEYLVFLTQDATPADKNWLAKIIEPMEKDAKVAGVFGRHLPRKNCDPFQRKMLNDFMEILKKNLICQLISDNRGEEFEKNKNELSFFSNVNSAIRRSIWEKIPFPEVEMGEDQFWTKKILLAGYKKAYAPEAKVYHSHNYGIWNQFKRWFDEYCQHKKNLNYIGVSSIFKIPLLTLRMAFHDVKYILRQKEYNSFQKIYWSIWIFFMDLARFSAEYLGGRYDKLPKWMRNKLSMQWELIHKK